MSEQTYEFTLPSGLAEALVLALERILKNAGFEESLKAGEVGGVETSVWQKGDARVVVTLRESEAEETISVSAQGVDSTAFVRDAASCLTLKLIESLPAEIQKPFEPVLAQLRELATCPNL